MTLIPSPPFVTSSATACDLGALEAPISERIPASAHLSEDLS